MGYVWSDTPPAEWVSAKMLVEYGVHLVNKFICRAGTTDIPLPIARMFAGNLERAIALLPREARIEPYWTGCFKEVRVAMQPLLAINEKAGHLSGSMPVTALDSALIATHELFVHAYVVLKINYLKGCYLACEPSTEDGFVVDWDSEKYSTPEEDPNLKIDPWDSADKALYQQLYELGRDYWALNESQIYAGLLWTSAGICPGSSCSGADKTQCVETEIELIKTLPCGAR